MGATDDIGERITRDDVDIIRYAAGLVLLIRKRLVKMDAAAVAAFKRIDPTAPRLEAHRIKRVARVDEAIKPIVGMSYKEMFAEERKAHRAIVPLAAEATRKAVNSGVKVDVFRVSLDREATVTVTRSILVDGRTLGDWWDANAESYRKEFTGRVRRGIQGVQGAPGGRTLTQIARDIQGTRVTGRRGSVVVRSMRQAEALVRTGMNRAVNEARGALYAANAEVLRGLQAWNPLDDRTSPICRARAGASWTMDGEPLPGSGGVGRFPGYPPWHWGCRSTIIPIILPWKDLEGLNTRAGRRIRKDVERMGAQGRAGLDGKPAQGLTYEGFLNKQSAAEQRKILGPGRYKLWKEDSITMQRMVNQQGRPLTIQQLERNLASRD